MSGTKAKRSEAGAAGSRGHTCPAWAGPLLCCPLRRWLAPPEKLLAPHVPPGAAVLEPGCGMGHYSLPLARLVGEGGRLVCVDLQLRMLDGLRRRALGAGLLGRIETVVCTEDDLGVAARPGRFDVAVAIHVVHEVADPERFLRQVFAALRPGGRLLLLEPRGHVAPGTIAAELAAAGRAGFRRLRDLSPRFSAGALLEKPGAA